MQDGVLGQVHMDWFIHPLENSPSSRSPKQVGFGCALLPALAADIRQPTAKTSEDESAIDHGNADHACWYDVDRTLMFCAFIESLSSTDAG